MTIGVLIPVDVEDPIRRVDYGGLSAMQQLVGGNIENVPYPPDDRVSIFIDEEGKFDGAEVNPRATALCGPHLFAGDDIRGPVLVCGFDPETGENDDLPDGWEDEHLAKRRELPEPDEVEHKDRSVQYRWKLRTEGETTHYAVLSCGHQRAGTSFLSGQQHGNEFYATLRNEEEEDSPYGKSIGFMLGSGVSLVREQVTRYSQKGMDQFAELALARLRAIYGESDPRVTKYFTVENGASLGAVS